MEKLLESIHFFNQISIPIDKKGYRETFGVTLRSWRIVLVFFKEGVICVFIIWSYASQPVANITHAYGPSEFFFWLYINKWHLLVATTSIHGW